MRGVVLAGGLGTRLYPLTKVTNKHLLPVYDKPMIYYPIEALRNAGIKRDHGGDGREQCRRFSEATGQRQDFGLKRIHYAYQEGEGGIADALSLAESFAEGGPICVVLGDNIIEKNIVQAVKDYKEQGGGARIMLKEVQDPQRFGVPVFDGDRITEIEEKPKKPKSNYAVIGIYMYDSRVFDIIHGLTPSERGELEITDVNNDYIQKGTMKWSVLDGWWTDAGTIESLLKAGNLVASTGANKI